MADSPFAVSEEKKGPAAGLEPLFRGEMTIPKVMYCGDNFINTEENWPSVQAQLRQVMEEEKPDVVIAGPAFNAGRYGVACARVCDYVRRELGIPSLTGMWWENPAVGMYGKDNYIVATPETATGMRKALPAMAALALKLAEREIHKNAIGEYPVMLLDDVLSELDLKRQEYVLNRIAGGQVFITCCENNRLDALRQGKVFHIRKGEVL